MRLPADPGEVKVESPSFSVSIGIFQRYWQESTPLEEWVGLRKASRRPSGNGMFGSRWRKTRVLLWRLFRSLYEVWFA